MPACWMRSTRNERLRKYRSSGSQRARSSPFSRCAICCWLPPTSISSVTTRMRARSAMDDLRKAVEQAAGLDAHVELALDLGATGLGVGIAGSGIGQQRGDGVRERRRIALVDEPAADAVVDELGNAGNARADHR